MNATSTAHMPYAKIPTSTPARAAPSPGVPTCIPTRPTSPVSASVKPNRNAQWIARHAAHWAISVRRAVALEIRMRHRRGDHEQGTDEQGQRVNHGTGEPHHAHLERSGRPNLADTIGRAILEPDRSRERACS